MFTNLRRSTIRLSAVAALLMFGANIPAEASDCGGAYTVRAGDTLSRIARHCGTSVEALMRANPQASPTALAIGETISVPGSDSPAGDDTAAMTSAEEAVTLQGWIVNGPRCAMLATEDGERYGVVSPDLSFVNGRAVAIEGEIIDDPSCSGPNTLLVTDLSTAEL